MKRHIYHGEYVELTDGKVIGVPFYMNNWRLPKTGEALTIGSESYTVATSWITRYERWQTTLSKYILERSR